ncbi:MAG: hypothetical protein K6B41_01050 [Butyrivibrio sp.]|nr:hypothetical protein [Butyrivibrio sp.]
MRVTVGRSGNQNIAVAVNEATANIRDASFILFITTSESLLSVSSILNKNYPGISIVGICGVYYHESLYSDYGLEVIAFDTDFCISIGLIDNLFTYPISNLSKLHKSLEEVGAQPDNTICLEFCSGNEYVLTTTLHTTLSKFNVPLLGGSLYGTKPLISINGHIYENSGFYAVIKTNIGRLNIYRGKDLDLINMIKKYSETPEFIFTINNQYKHNFLFKNRGLDRFLRSMSGISTVHSGIVVNNTQYKNIRPDKGIVCAVLINS